MLAGRLQFGIGVNNTEQAQLGGAPDQCNAGRMVFSPEEDK